MASKPKPDRVSKEALSKPPGSEPHDQPVRDVRQDPAPQSQSADREEAA